MLWSNPSIFPVWFSRSCFPELLPVLQHHILRNDHHSFNNCHYSIYPYPRYIVVRKCQGFKLKQVHVPNEASFLVYFNILLSMSIHYLSCQEYMVKTLVVLWLRSPQSIPQQVERTKILVRTKSHSLSQTLLSRVVPRPSGSSHME